MSPTPFSCRQGLSCSQDPQWVVVPVTEQGELSFLSLPAAGPVYLHNPPVFTQPPPGTDAFGILHELHRWRHRAALGLKRTNK